MSYRLDVALDAQLTWRDLDIDVQEKILDELDHVANNVTSAHAAEFIHDHVFNIGQMRHYVFLSLSLDAGTRTLTVLGIGHWARDLGPAAG